MMIHIRTEGPEDHRNVEEMVREAFWNLHVPGCDEHYLTHIMRDHPDFVPELALVALEAGEVVGCILHTRSRLVARDGTTLDTLTFGPLCVRKGRQREGIGSALVAEASRIATGMGCPALAIYGHPKNYCSMGFRGADAYDVSDADGNRPFGLLVKELVLGALTGRAWTFHPSPVYEFDPAGLEAYDASFPPLEKRWEPSQEEFRIACAARIPLPAALSSGNGPSSFAPPHPLAFLLEMDKLKEIWRKNGVHGTNRRENSAEHSWHAAVAALALADRMPAGTDATRVATLMVAHDLGEIDTGDQIAYGKDEEKAAREEGACVDRLAALLPGNTGDGIRHLWCEFGEGATPEAKVAQAIDRLLPCLENLSASGGAWRTHGVRLEQALERNAAIGRVFPDLWDEIRPRLEAAFRTDA
jgi:hypothetical protein